MEIETLLHREIANELEELSSLEVGTQEHSKAVDVLTKLIDRAIEMEKLGHESEEKAERRAIENRKLDIESTDKTELRAIENRKLDLETTEKTELRVDEKKDRLVRNCIAVAGIVIPSVITVWGTLKTIEFEKEGTITTIMGRGFINKLLPKK